MEGQSTVVNNIDAIVNAVVKPFSRIRYSLKKKSQQQSESSAEVGLKSGLGHPV